MFFGSNMEGLFFASSIECSSLVILKALDLTLLDGLESSPSGAHPVISFKKGIKLIFLAMKFTT